MVSKKNEMYKCIIAFVIIAFFCMTAVVPVHAATTAILTWDLVDSGKHLDWGGSTVYQTQFQAGVNTWNSYKSEVIRKDTLITVQDLTISDYYEISTTGAYCSTAGVIKFNTYVLDQKTTTEQLYACTHEVGHALGLAHNQSTDVMYMYISNNCTLTANDKASYDASYNRY